MDGFRVVALYKFCRIAPERLDDLRSTIYDFCAQFGIRGLFLLSVEGCNGTMAGPPESMEAFVAFLESLPEVGSLTCKYSGCDYLPFERLKVDLREEIVTLKRPDIYPEQEKNYHLSPEDWHRIVTSEEEDFILIDTRNTYETEIGKFRGAITPPLTHFSEFPDYVKNQDIPKEKKVLMYCTGGIRCEKALLYMKQEGYQNVFQLDGGILNYLEKFPDGAYEGECFVFDERIAVDNHLQPSQRYHRCPHCGDPAPEAVSCAFCGNEGFLCLKCAEDKANATCSKNCAYQWRLRQQKSQKSLQST